MKKTMQTSAFEIKRHSSIDELDSTHWNDYIAQNNPFKNTLFMRCVESAFADRSYCYFSVYKKSTSEKKLLGLVFTTQEDWDLQLILPSVAKHIVRAVRHIYPRFALLKLGMTGCMETAESHWWFDESINSDTAAQLVVYCLESAQSGCHISIIRDLLPSNIPHRNMLSVFFEHHYSLVQNLPLAQINLSGMSAEQHFNRLKSKFRKSVKKALKQCHEQGITIEHSYNVSGSLERLYPLYLEVHERAREYKREPIPKTFFQMLGSMSPEQTFVTLMKNQNGKILGFVLSGINESYCVPFVFGRDYEASDNANVYYSLLWEVMQKAGQHGVDVIDLGVTNYFVKQNLGAEIVDMNMACKFNNRFFNSILSPFINQILGAEQPTVRELFKQKSSTPYSTKNKSAVGT